MTGDAPKLCDEVAAFFLASATPVLFAGAGVSVRAGVPNWAEYLNRLAEAIRPYDALTANQMKENISRGRLAKAASYFFLTDEIREGDRLRALSEPLVQFDVRPLSCIAALPFTAYVTTNFDRVLADLYAFHNRKSPVAFDLGDPALGSAAFRDEFFVARIHGKVEDPRSMVLAEAHFTDLPQRPGYLALLRHVFTFRQVLFVGFSFLDPAVSKVLELVNSEIGPLHAGRHLALLPKDAGNDFVAKLERLNIRRVTYEPVDGHRELWEGICCAQEKLEAAPTRAVVTSSLPEPMVLARKFIAACYARTQLGERMAPLREIILEGLISQFLLESDKNGKTKEDLKSELRASLQLPDSHAAEMVESALTRLSREALCKKTKGKDGLVRYQWKDQGATQKLSDAIAVLVAGTVHRYIVREQGHSTADIRSTLAHFYESLVLRRGWDLGAAFAAHRPPDAVDLDQLFWDVAATLSPKEIEPLGRVIRDLLTSPSEQEAQVLADLGRTSFALELAIQSPQDVLLHQAILPQRIYLDANVLLPAITTGHPFFEVYSASIHRLVGAAERASVTVQILTTEGYLNEVVSHRRIAREMVESDTNYASNVRTQARAFGSPAINVFLSAYASLFHMDESLTFDEFLAKHAPYENETQLRAWLSDRGIRVVSSLGATGADTIFGDIYHQLEIAFARELEQGKRPPIVIRHDSVQLTMLDEDRKRGLKSIFVSSDRTLREYVGGSKYPQLANCMVSHVGLSQLIDLIVGSGDEPRKAVARLLWPARISSELEVVRNYLIDLALSKYDEAMAMTMGDVVDRVSRLVLESASASGITLFSPNDQDRRRAATLLEGFEDEFYAGMSEVIERRRRQEQ